MLDKITLEDIAKIKGTVKDDSFEQKVLVTGGVGFIGSWLLDLLALLLGHT